MGRKSTIVIDAMLKDAAEAINHDSTQQTAEVGRHLGWPCLILSLNDEPHVQIVAHVRNE
jgi:hypothetical protein